MSETAISQEEMARISKRALGRAHDRPCRDPSVISCRRFKCQKAHRCMMSAKKTPKEPRPDAN